MIGWGWGLEMCGGGDGGEPRRRGRRPGREGWVDGDAGRVSALDGDSWWRWEENTAGVARP